MLKDDLDYLNIYVPSSKNASERYKNKAAKAKEKGKLDKAQKYLDKSKHHSELNAKFIKQRNKTIKQLEAIGSGKMKAGRDFIVQTDYDVYGAYIPGLVGAVNIYRTDTLIERPKKK